jgi:hypothetical protein
MSSVCVPQIVAMPVRKLRAQPTALGLAQTRTKCSTAPPIAIVHPTIFRRADLIDDSASMIAGPQRTTALVGVSACAFWVF